MQEAPDYHISTEPGVSGIEIMTGDLAADYALDRLTEDDEEQINMVEAVQEWFE